MSLSGAPAGRAPLELAKGRGWTLRLHEVSLGTWAPEEPRLHSFKVPRKVRRRLMCQGVPLHGSSCGVVLCVCVLWGGVGG